MDKSVRLFGFQRAKCTSFHKRKNHPYTKRPNVCYRLRTPSKPPTKCTKCCSICCKRKLTKSSVSSLALNCNLLDRSSREFQSRAKKSVRSIPSAIFSEAGRGILVPRVLSYPSVEDSSISPIQKRSFIVYRKIPKISPSKYKPLKPVTR